MATKSERFPKEYYNAAMLKDKPPLVLTIEEERLEEITNPKTGKTSNKSVLAFEDHATKLIVNSVNFDLLTEVTGETDTANWAGHEIELYADKTNMGGERVDCVRVRAPGSGPPPPAPKKKKASPAPVLDVSRDVLASESSAVLKAAPTLRGDLDDDISF